MRSAGVRRGRKEENNQQLPLSSIHSALGAMLGSLAGCDKSAETRFIIPILHMGTTEAQKRSPCPTSSSCDGHSQELNPHLGDTKTSTLSTMTTDKEF